MTASPPPFSVDLLYMWLSWLWAVFLPTVVMVLGTTLGTAVIAWIYSRIHQATDAINEIINTLQPRV